MKRSVIKIVVTLLMTAAIAVGICVLINKDSIFREKTEKVEIYKNIEFTDKLELEAGEEIEVEKYIDRIIGGELTFDEEKIKEIDTKVLGEIPITLTIKDLNGDSQEFILKLKIVDTTVPEIKNEKDKFTITEGEKVDLLKDVTAEDNIDGEIEVKIDGTYDANKEGEYKLKYVAEDKSGNKAEKEITLQVNKKVNTTSVKNQNNNSTSNNNSSKSNSSKKSNSTSNTSSSDKGKSEGYNVSGQGLLSLVNQARSKEGANNLSWSSELERAAKIRAKEISENFSHTRPDNTLCFTVSSSASGENIAYGATSVNGVNQQWTNSPGHYNNMVNKEFRIMGAAGYVVNGTYYWVELFGY